MIRNLAFAALLASGAAFAQHAPDRSSASAGSTSIDHVDARQTEASRRLFERLDKNHDGYLDQTEQTSAEALSSNWISVDRDGDGHITRSEFAAIPSAGNAVAESKPPQPLIRRRP